LGRKQETHGGPCEDRFEPLEGLTEGFLLVGLLPKGLLPMELLCYYRRTYISKKDFVGGPVTSLVPSGSYGKVASRQIVGIWGNNRKHLPLEPNNGFFPIDHRLQVGNPLLVEQDESDDNQSSTIEIQEEKTLYITGGVNDSKRFTDGLSSTDGIV
jgi:hypothetical protein